MTPDRPYSEPGVRFQPGQTVELAPPDAPAGLLSAAESERYRIEVAQLGRVHSGPWRWGGLDG